MIYGKPALTKQFWKIWVGGLRSIGPCLEYGIYSKGFPMGPCSGRLLNSGGVCSTRSAAMVSGMIKSRSAPRLRF